MSFELFVVAGQSNAKRFDSTGIMSDAISQAGLAAEVVRVAEGGTSMEPRDNRNDWYPFEDGDPLSGEMVTDLLAQIDAAMAAGVDRSIGAFVWMQGETDANSKYESSDYAAKLQGLHDLLRALYGEDFPFIIMRLSENAPAIGVTNVGDWDEVQAAQTAFADANPGVILIDPDEVALALGLPEEEMFRDGMHLVDELYEEIAQQVLSLSERFGQADLSATGTSGIDLLLGVETGEILSGFKGHDIIRAGAGDDIVQAGRGMDEVWLEQGDDIAFGAKGNDEMRGQAGFDTLYGGRGNDALFGGAAGDLVSGHDGNDLLEGGAGDDTLRGGAGDDVLRGGEGRDNLVGGDGADWFEFATADRDRY